MPSKVTHSHHIVTHDPAKSQHQDIIYRDSGVQSMHYTEANPTFEGATQLFFRKDSYSNMILHREEFLSLF